MTPKEFRTARRELGFSQKRLATLWSMGDNSDRTIRRWECGERPLNSIAAYCIKMMSDTRSTIDDPDRPAKGKRP